MATITPAYSNVSARGADAVRLLWTPIATVDTLTGISIGGSSTIRGSVQFSGTFGAATVKLQVSNDGTTYFDMKDISGTTISATAAGHFEFQTAAVYLRPAISGGTGDAVTVTVSLRQA